MEELRQQAEDKKLDIEFDEDETWKAVGDRSANFNNAIGTHTRDLLLPYYFTYKEQPEPRRNLIWERISSQFRLKDTEQHRAAIVMQTKKSLKEWHHDLHQHYKKVVDEHGLDGAPQHPHHSVDGDKWCNYIRHVNSERFQVK